MGAAHSFGCAGPGQCPLAHLRRARGRGTFYQGYLCTRCGVGAHKECLEVTPPCKTGECHPRAAPLTAALWHPPGPGGVHVLPACRATVARGPDAEAEGGEGTCPGSHGVKGPGGLDSEPNSSPNFGVEGFLHLAFAPFQL